MKTIKNLFLVAFISMSTFACSSDDDSSGGGTTEQNEARIIGAWLFVSSTTDGVADDIEDCELMDTAVFTASQVTFAYFEGIDCEDTGSETVNYSIDGNSITISFEGESFTSEITTLNSTTLTVKDIDDGEVYTETYSKQ